MSTMIIKIDEPVVGGGYRITLRDFDPLSREFGSEINIEDEIQYPLPALGEATEDAATLISGVLQDRRRPPEALRDIGRYLHDLLKANEVGRKWFSLCEESDCIGNEVRMRTYIDIQPEMLQRLPWELIPYKIGHGENPDDAAFKSRGHRVMRGRPEQQGVVPALTPAPLPIRVLVVVCDKSQELRAEDEVDAIYAGLCRQPGVWQVEVLREPNWDALADTLRVFPPQILHLIAHAGNTKPSTFKVRRPAPAAGADRDYWDLTVGDIEELLVDQESLPLLFVLNACHTAAMVPAERFRRLGTKGVIVTQAEINSAEAVCFTQAFYRHLADKGSLENAMWHARVEMRRRRRFDHHDWGIPV